MISKSTPTTRGAIFDIDDDPIEDYYIPSTRTQSSSYLLTPDSAITVKSISSNSSNSSLAQTPSPKSSFSSFLRVSPPNVKFSKSSSSEERLQMTLVRTPSPRSSPTPEPVGSSTTTNDDSLNTNKFFKSKVTAAFNHVKYRWAVKMRPNFRTNDSAIVFLGKMYNGKEDSDSDEIPRSHSEQPYSNFLKALSERIYFSYRKPFEPLAGTRSGELIISDGGWGCMIRCAQMLLAQALLLQKTYPINPHYSHIQASDKCPKRDSIECFRPGNRAQPLSQIYRDIIRLFGDYPNQRCPFGIHKIVELGIAHGIRPGEFFGPVSAAHCLKEAVQLAVEAQQFPDVLRVYISQDAIIYRQDVNDLCTQGNVETTKKNSLYPSLESLSNESNNTRWKTSVLILIPLRLGLNELDLVYEEYLKDALKLPQTVGIIGGSPRHAVYILGYQDDSFIDLDPHFSQTTVNVLEEHFDISSYSFSTPKKLTARKMDPCCALGFYCQDKADFEMFCAQWNRVYHLAPDDRRACPIFRIEPGSFAENHHHSLNYEYPSSNDDEHVYLRVKKLSAATSSPSSSSSTVTNRKFNSLGKGTLLNSARMNSSFRESWDDAERSLTKHGRLRSFSDDYVFL